MGDFNAITSISPDHLPIDINVFGSADSDVDLVFDCDVPPELATFNLEISRNSKDVTMNKLGRILLCFCRENNMIILNGRSFSDKAGSFTCNDASVVDYVLSSVESLKLFSEFRIIDLCPLLSDKHCPVTFAIVTPVVLQDDNSGDTQCVNKVDPIIT